MSSTAQLPNILDLTATFPRSPGAKVGPYVLLGRIIDKCRAVIAGCNGEYNYNCPLDRRFFDFTGIDSDQFKAWVASGMEDTALLDAVNQYSQNHSTQEIETWAQAEATRTPDTPEKQEYFNGLKSQFAPERTDIHSWFQLLDAEEGRY